MNPTGVFRNLVSLFPEDEALFGSAEHIPAALTPEPYKGLLVHDRHMTIAMEGFHHSPIVVEVLDRKLNSNIYSRKILLKRSDNGAVVQFAVMRFDLETVLPAVRNEILSEQTPLGRILINYNVPACGLGRDFSDRNRSLICPIVRLPEGRSDLWSIGNHFLQPASGRRPSRSCRANRITKGSPFTERLDLAPFKALNVRMWRP